MKRHRRELGIGAAFDLCLDHSGSQGSRYSPFEKKASCQGLRDASSSPSSELPSALCGNMIDQADLARPTGTLQSTKSTGSSAMRYFWQDFSSAVGRDQVSAHETQVYEAPAIIFGPDSFRRARWRQSARTSPCCRRGLLSLEDRALSPFIGCSELSRCRYHLASSRPGTVMRGGQPGAENSGRIPQTGSEVSVRERALRPLGTSAAAGMARTNGSSIPATRRRFLEWRFASLSLPTRGRQTPGGISWPGLAYGLSCSIAHYAWARQEFCRSGKSGMTCRSPESRSGGGGDPWRSRV